MLRGVRSTWPQKKTMSDPREKAADLFAMTFVTFSGHEFEGKPKGKPPFLLGLPPFESYGEAISGQI